MAEYCKAEKCWNDARLCDDHANVKADAEWNAAIEAAAVKVAQHMNERWGLENTGIVMASEIRALKREAK